MRWEELAYIRKMSPRRDIVCPPVKGCCNKQMHIVRGTSERYNVEVAFIEVMPSSGRATMRFRLVPEAVVRLSSAMCWAGREHS